MMSWWFEREPREQVLLSIMGALLALVIFWFLVLSPVLSAHEQAQSRFDKAQRNHEVVAKALPQLNPGSTVASGPLTRSQIVEAALQDGIQLARVQPQGQDQITIWIENVDSRSLFGFLNRLITEKGAALNRVTINKTDAGLLTAQFSVSVRN